MTAPAGPATAASAAPAAPPVRHAVVPRTVAVVLALLLVGAGVVAAREALAATSSLGLVPSDAWWPGAVGALDGRAVDGAVALVGAVVLVLGVLLLVAAAHRGPSDVGLRAAPAVRLRSQDVARVASAAAQDVDGVLDATSAASARSVRVRVVGTGADGLGDAVRDAVEQRLAALDPAPRVRVVVADRGGRP